MTIPDKVKIFLSGAKDVSLGYNEINFFDPENLLEEQMGYSIDINGNTLITGADGDWKEEWLVIASDGLGDPFIVDTGSQQLTILTAPHGEGTWEPNVIADSLDNFKYIVSLIHDVARGRDNPVEIEKNPIPAKQKKNILKQIETLNPYTDISYWEDFLEND